MLIYTPEKGDTFADAVAALGPLFEIAFVAAVLVVMLALLVIGVWGALKGYPGVKAHEPQPG